MARKSGKRVELSAWLDRRKPAVIDEAAFEELRGSLAPISEGYLRKLLRESRVALAPMVAGVRQGDFAELEASLLDLLEEYETGDSARRDAVRRVVIKGKDHARWAAKEEMALWVLTWLENPPLFPQWVKLRRALLDKTPSSS